MALNGSGVRGAGPGGGSRDTEHVLGGCTAALGDAQDPAANTAYLCWIGSGEGFQKREGGKKRTANCSNERRRDGWAG